MMRVWSDVDIININCLTESDRAKYSHRYEKNQILKSNFEQFKMNWQKIWSNTLWTIFNTRVEAFLCPLRVCSWSAPCVCSSTPVLSCCVSFVLAPSRPAAALIECRLLTAHIRHSSLMRKLAGTTYVLQMSGWSKDVSVVFVASYTLRGFFRAPRC